MSDAYGAVLVSNQEPFYILQMNTENRSGRMGRATLQADRQYGIELAYDFPEVDFRRFGLRDIIRFRFMSDGGLIAL